MDGDGVWRPYGQKQQGQERRAPPASFSPHQPELTGQCPKEGLRPPWCGSARASVHLEAPREAQAAAARCWPTEGAIRQGCIQLAGPAQWS